MEKPVNQRAIVIIPARGGSKGIPRKNLRPLNGKPMIYYSIKASLSAKRVCRVIVSTDDEEMALFARRFGAEVLMRPSELANDAITLDPVIDFTVKQAEARWKEHYEVIVTVQPTSPLITAREIDDSVIAFDKASIDTVLSVVDDRHLCWTIDNGNAIPRYADRINRQELPANYKETGAVIACTRTQLERGSRIGDRVVLMEVPHDRSFDIDTFADMALCEYLLKRKRIVFAVVGYAAVGLGHAYRALTLAHELVHYDIHFVCEKKSDLAIEHIREQNYMVHICEDGVLAESVIALCPDLVVNDILDTEEYYIKQLKQSGIKVINFEDMGPGSEFADLVINALYPDESSLDHVLVGPKYFCLRDEFLFVPKKVSNDRVQKILLTFGGVDEGNLTVRILKIIGQYCIEKDIAVDLVTGPGFSHESELRECLRDFDNLKVNIAMGTRGISDYMCQADLAITSGGRTVLELAALGVPAIVICQNLRETTHTFASIENGVICLGHREDVQNEDIRATIENTIEDSELLESLRNNIRSHDFRNGKKRVIKRIISTLGE